MRKRLTPAILAYDGIQYTYMAPDVFEQQYFDYVQEHVRILSGFYGSVKPLDGVVSYRLEMQAKAKIDGCKNLYEFWCDSLYREVLPEGRIIINLASKEYSKCVEKYLQPQDTPSFSASCKTARSCRRAFTQKWQEAKWFALPLKSTRNRPKN